MRTTRRYQLGRGAAPDTLAIVTRCGGARRMGLALALALGGGLGVASSGCASLRDAGPSRSSETPREDAPRHRIVARSPGHFTDPLRIAKLWLAIPELSRIASQVLAEDGVPGMAVALVVDDDIVWSAGFGVQDVQTGAAVTPASVFGIGSITKPITALAILRLRDEGMLALDATAATHLPELAGVALPRGDLRGPTIRELLTHTSGMPRLGDFSYSTPPHEPSQAEILGSLSDYALWHPPGEHMYSNLGYHLLGLVVERVSGEPMREHISRTILAPIGIERAWWDHADVPESVRTTPYALEHGEVAAKPSWRHGAGAGAGALLLDIEGLATLARFELAAYAADPPSAPVSAATVRESHVAVLSGLSAEADGGKLTAQATGYGMGWSVHYECTGERVVSHGGGTEGYASSIQMLPDHGVAIVLLSNLNEWSRGPTLRRMIAALRDTGGLVAREPAPAPELLVAAGRWAELLGAWDEARFREVWSPHDHARDRIDRVGRFHATLAAMAGPCDAPAAATIHRPYVGDFTLACEHADVHVRVAATPANGGKILSVNAKLVGVSPRPELRRAAEATLALMSDWSEPAFTALFAPAFPIAGGRREVRDRGRRWGRCELGDVTEVRVDAATWNASCEHAEIELTIGSDRDDHRVTVFEASAKQPDRRRCK
jgi:CubicO group peptidase (beta-lactamase class C family)